jgi:hypothetical protein
MNAPLLLALTFLLNAVTVAADPVLSLSDEENYQAMQKALYGIRESLQEVREEFPQLSGIDTATIKMDGLRDAGRVRLDYEKGVLKEDMSGVAFAESGCDIVVQIAYPATRADVEMRPQLNGDLFPLDDEKSYAVWSLVRAEDNEAGNAFKTRANTIINYHLKLMHAKLKGIIK